MAQMFEVDVDAKALIAMLDRVGPSVDFHARDVGRETAVNIVAEARGRVARATGETGEGIHYEKTRDDSGYVVLGYESGRQEDPVDRYLEYGTKYMLERPFFFSSAVIEAASHQRRLATRVQDVLRDLGR